jgi:hypothetical protein
MPLRCMGEWRYISIIHSLATRWRWVVSFVAEERPPGIPWSRGWVGPRAPWALLRTGTFVAPSGRGGGRKFFEIFKAHHSEYFHHLWACGYRRGMDWWMGLLTTYTHHSELQVNYSVIADFCTLQITTAPAKLLSACSVSSSRSITTASNSGHKLHALMPSCHSRPCRTRQLSTEILVYRHILSVSLPELNWTHCQSSVLYNDFARTE